MLASRLAGQVQSRPKTVAFAFVLVIVTLLFVLPGNTAYTSFWGEENAVASTLAPSKLDRTLSPTQLRRTQSPTKPQRTQSPTSNGNIGKRMTLKPTRFAGQKQSGAVRVVVPSQRPTEYEKLLEKLQEEEDYEEEYDEEEEEEEETSENDSSNTEEGDVEGSVEELEDYTIEEEAEEAYDESVFDDEEQVDDSGEQEQEEEEPKPPRRNWFDKDPPGVDPEAVGTIWAKELSLAVNASRTDYDRRNPQIAFIKGLKVGGTTVAIALDGVARHYGIALQRQVRESANRGYNLKSVACTPGGSFWFHHGYKNPWMQACMPHVRFVTVIREPISQALSWETFMLSRDYYHKYPLKPCGKRRAGDLPDFSKGLLPYPTLERLLSTVSHCRDTALRKNITMQLVAHRVMSFKGGPGMAVRFGLVWTLGGPLRKRNAQQVLEYMRQNYFLVGVTPQINEFLLLLALHMGWDPTTLYYIPCKPTDLDIRAPEFAERFPDIYANLKLGTTLATKVYEGIAQDFESHLALLRTSFPEFNTLLAKFKTGLKQYQESRRTPNRPIYAWKPYKYIDSHHEFC